MCFCGAELSCHFAVGVDDQQVLPFTADENQPFFLIMFCMCALGTRLKSIASFEVSCYSL